MTSTAVVALIATGASADRSYAQELPQGGQVDAGQASIGAAHNGSLTVTQTSGTAVLGWQAFSIGYGGNVHFANGSGATLNRVIGNVPSSLNGTLTATGSLYLINPAGVTVGTNGFVSTGGSFVASTHDVDTAVFMTGGDLTFKGTSQAGVVNHGTISSATGDIALIARRVENTGTIEALNGTAGLAAGYEVLLRDSSHADGKIAVKVGGADTEARTSGTIKAAEVELRANGGNVYALAGNTKGVIKATGVENRGGRVFLTAPGGEVKVTQKVAARKAPAAVSSQSASSSPKVRAGGEVRIAADTLTLGSTIDVRGKGADGGIIVATGKTVKVDSTAKLNASGAMGGTILVGGDFQGGHDASTKFLAEDVARAQTTLVEAGAQIIADGTTGDGGKIVVWSDDATVFEGHVSATGADTGDGGFAEVSGKAFLGFNGTVDLRAEAGETGTLLLDPYNVTISNSATSNGALADGTFTPTGTSILNVTTLTNALANANVLVTTGGAGSPGAQDGDITVSNAITWSSSSTLTLNAYRNITVDANITGAAGAQVVLRADNSGTGTGTVSFASSSVDVTATGGVSIYYNPSSYTAATNYSGNQGAGTAITAYMLVNTLNQLQSINTNSTTRAGTYALGRDIDATATAGWNSGAGFVPIGTNANSFTGTFDGQGYTISGLYINRASTDYVGLFGATQNSSLSKIALINAAITGRDYVGGIAGLVSTSGAGTSGIGQSYTSGTISGASNVGGLVGGSQSTASGTSITINSSYSTATVSASADRIGGLVGYADHTTASSVSILDSWASGTVSGRDDVGGLIGRFALNSGASFTVGQSHASGVVSGRTSVGGLLGRTEIWGTGSTGTMTEVYASGNVSGQNQIGGLIGEATSYGTGGFQLTRAYATGNVTASASDAAGLVAIFKSYNTTYSHIKNAYALGSVTGVGTLGGFVGFHFSDSGSATALITDSYSTGQVIGTGANIGGFSAVRVGGASIANSFWDQTTSTISQAVGSGSSSGVSNSGSAAYTQSTYTAAGWNFTNDWFMVAGSTRPFGRWEYSTTITNSHQLQLMAIDLSANYTLANNISLSDLSQAGGMWTSAGFSPVGSDSTRFTGSLNGNGYVINGLYSNRATVNVALIHTIAAAGEVRNLNLTNVNITGSGRSAGLAGSNYGIISNSSSSGTVQVTGGTAGGLVGENNDTGSISGSWSGGTVTTSADVSGGLVGTNIGVISSSYSTAAVVSGNNWAGGLVGRFVSGMIEQSYATGSVSSVGSRIGGLVGLMSGGTIRKSYATGNVSGNEYIGGLVGTVSADGIIETSYALGSVTGTNSVGGLIGIHQSSGGVSETYATGTVTGTTNLGGLIGSKIGSGAISASFWDTGSTGHAQAVGNITNATGVTAIQSSNAGAANYAFNAATYTAAGWDMAGTWGVVAGVSYPYHRWRFASGPSIISGAVSGVSGGNDRVGVAVAVDGIKSTANTGANGVYYFALDPISDGAVLGWLTGTRFGAANISERANVIATVTGNKTGFDLAPGLVNLTTGFSSLTGTVTGLLAQAKGAISDSAILYTTSGSALTLTSNYNWNINATGAFSIDTNLTAGGTGKIRLAAGGALAIASGARVTSAASGDAVILAGTTFNNQRGSDAINLTGSGRWQVFANAPTGNTYGNLDSGNTAVWNQAYSPSASVGAVGNRYVFDYKGTLTFTSTDQSKTYGDILSLSAAYNVTGLQAAVANAYLGDTLGTAISGAASITSAGASATANVGSYGIAISQGTISSTMYNLNFSSTGNLTVGQRALTVTADDASRSYGDANPAFAAQVTAGSLAAHHATLGDALADLAVTSAATAASDVGAYDIAALGTNANYALTFLDGTLTVGQRALTVTADDASKTYGDANPAFAAQVTAGSLAAHHATLGDALADLAVTSAATAASDVGAYDIAALGTNANYALTFLDGTLTVGQRALTVTADDASKTYNATDPVLTWSITSGSLASFNTMADVFSGSISRNTGEEVGYYSIIQGSLSANPNYQLYFNQGTLHIIGEEIPNTKPSIEFKNSEKHQPIEIIIPIKKMNEILYSVNKNQTPSKCKSNDNLKECGDNN